MKYDNKQLLDFTKETHNNLLNKNRGMTKIFSSLLIMLGGLVTAVAGLFTVYCICSNKTGYVEKVFFIMNVFLIILNAVVEILGICTEGYVEKQDRQGRVNGNEHRNASNSANKELNERETDNSNFEELNKPITEEINEIMENIIEKEVINISENKIESQEDRIDVMMIRFYHLKNKEMQKKIKTRKKLLALSFAYNLLSIVFIAITVGILKF